MVPRFITLEGIDGSGKGVHLKWMEAWCVVRDIPCVITREPGGVPFAEAIRDTILDARWQVPIDAECLSMYAARIAHCEYKIKPALSEGYTILCDRFLDSTYAYQGSGRGLDVQRLNVLTQWYQFPKPDRTFLLDISPETACLRRHHRERQQNDRFELEQLTFHEKVRMGFLQRARDEPQRICVIDAEYPVETIQAQLHEQLSDLFPTN